MLKQLLKNFIANYLLITRYSICILYKLQQRNRSCKEDQWYPHGHGETTHHISGHTGTACSF